MAKIVDIVHGDADHRMTGALKRVDGGILRGIGRRFQAKVGKYTIVAVHLGRAQAFPVDGDESLADLAGGFGQQLLQPGPQIRDTGRRDDGDLVAAVFPGHSQHNAEHHSGILFHRNCGPAGIHHFFRCVEEFGKVHAHDGGRHHAEIRQCRITSADAGESEEDAPELVAFGHLLHVRLRIGDGDESPGSLLLTDRFLHAFKEILFEDVRFERAARFA